MMVKIKVGPTRWDDDASREIIRRLGPARVKAEYERMGAVWTSGEGGYGVECFGIFDDPRLGKDGTDDKPSAAININGENGRLGQYTDLGNIEEPLSFFEVAGRKLFGDWRRARSHYAQKVGYTLNDTSANGSTKSATNTNPKPKKKKLALDQLQPFDDPHQVNSLLLTFARTKPGVKIETLQEAKATAARWTDPYDKQVYVVIALEARIPGNDGDPDAALMYRVDGKPFPGHGKQKESKMRMLGGSNGKQSIFSIGDRASAETIYYCEGAPDAIAITPHLPAGAVAVSGCIGANSPDSKSLKTVFRDRAVVILPDTDEVGLVGGRKVAEAAMRAEAKEVKIVPPPAGMDVRDMVVAGKVSHLLQAVKKADPVTEKQIGLKPQITLGLREDVAVDEAIAALSKDQETYQRGGRLVYVTGDARPKSSKIRWTGGLRIAVMPVAKLRTRLTAIAEFISSSIDEESGEVEEKPTRIKEWLVNGVFGDGQWDGVRPLISVSEVPVLLGNGEIVQQPGYSSDYGILYQPRVKFPPVTERPIKDDAIASAGRLLDVARDFPFAGDTYRAAYLAAVLTPLVKQALESPTPLFLIDANTRGCGKGLLATAIGMVSTGHKFPAASYSHETPETRKLITSIAVDGLTTFLIDNIAGTFGNAALDAALTATSWRDRLLSKNETVHLPLSCVFYGTSNNAALGADTARRVCPIRLESPLERPEERTGFEQPYLEEWLRANWTALFTDAMTVLRAFIAADAPQQSITPWGSFEAWSAIVRQAVLWVGLPDPAGGKHDLAEHADLDAGLLGALMSGWETAFGEHGLTCRQAFDCLRTCSDGTTDALREAIANMPTAGRGMIRGRATWGISCGVCAAG